MKPTRYASLISALAMSTVLAFPALAQDAKGEDTHLAAAVAVVKQAGTLPPYEALLTQIGLNAKNVLIRQKPDAENEIIAAVDEITKSLENRSQKMESVVAQVWASYFTEEELKEILTFFQTETGQKFASYDPRIVGESVGALKKFNSELTFLIAGKAIEDLNAKGHKFK